MSRIHLLLLPAAVCLTWLSGLIQAQEVELPLPQNDLVDEFLPQRAALKQGYLITEDQLNRLSAAARAEVQKVLTDNQQRAQSAQIQLQKLLQDEATKFLESAVQNQYRYMIGVTVEPNETDKSGGVIVSRVIEDSPAQRAGVAPGNIILSVTADQNISNPQDLIQVVENSDGRQLVIHLKTNADAEEVKTIHVTPVERPEKYKHLIIQEAQSQTPIPVRTPAVQQETSPGDVRLRAFYPGIYWTPSGAQQELPENVTITITRTGKKPARITVKRDEQSWDLNEKELDQIPEDLREPVKRLLVHPGLPNLPPIPPIPATPAIPATPTTPQNQLNPLQQIQQELEELQKAVKELQQNQKQE